LQGNQGPAGPLTLCVQNTAFVDSLCATTGVVENEARPFPTISSALAAVTTARADPSVPWRVYVQPGTYTEADPGLVMIPNISIIGSGPATIYQGNFVTSTGPATVSNMQIQVPAGDSITIQGTFTLRDCLVAVQPNATNTTAFAFTYNGTDTPTLAMQRVFLTMTPSANTFATSIFQFATGNVGVTVPLSLYAQDVTAIVAGTPVEVVSITDLEQPVVVEIRDSYFDLTSGTQGGVPMILYGGTGIGFANPVSLALRVDNCRHVIHSGTPALSGIVYGQYLMASSTATLTSTSRYVVSNSVFDFVGFAVNQITASAASDNFSGGQFVQSLNNTWLGIELTSGAPSGVTTTYFPVDYNIGHTPGAHVIAQGVSPSGSVATSGGLQTGVTVIDSNATGYNVVDGDTFIVWSPNSPVATVTLPSSYVFLGKIVTFYNGNASGGVSFALASSGGNANGLTIAANTAAIVQTYNGSNWVVLSTT